ncbi:uncharacterized protein LOC134205795 isoform X1 [Armigeres subalbatus]|uniref:uncharacterized protein LOC134205795 isoform X1 n=1 Tax=Armigeres subalbatus TaxID=124917 RepID=UPI002ED68E58
MDSEGSTKVEMMDIADEAGTSVAPFSDLLCRTCRKQDQPAVPVEAVLDFHGKSITDMIFELTEIMVNYDANLPQSICFGCVEDLRSAYNFRQRCIDSNEMFLNELNVALGQASIPDDPNQLILKVEQSDPELSEISQNETFEDQSSFEFDAEPMDDVEWNSPAAKRRKSRKKNTNTLNCLARSHIVTHEDRHYCFIDPLSKCRYFQEILEMGNFVRHFRLIHCEEAKSKGFFPKEGPKIDVTPNNEKTEWRYSRIAMKCIAKHDNRYYCKIDPSSECVYSQSNDFVVGNFIRHFRLMHADAAEKEGLMREVLPTKRVPDARIMKRNRKEFPAKLVSIAEKYMRESDDSRFYCTIDEQSSCKFSRQRANMTDFIQHFRVAHPKAAASKIFSLHPLVNEVPSPEPLPHQEKVMPKDTVKSVSPALVMPKTNTKVIALPQLNPCLTDQQKVSSSKQKSYFVQIVSKFVKPEHGRFRCIIDENSGCHYAQVNYDAGNFIRHFRSRHPDEAISNGFVRNEKHMKQEEKKRVIKKLLVGTDIPQLLEACIKLVTLHNFPIQCFGWTGMRLLLEPLMTTLDLEINETCMIEYIHMAAESLTRIAQMEMKHKVVSIQLESIIQKGTLYLTVSANYDYVNKVNTRVLGVIRATETLTARELEVKLFLLLDRFHISKDQVIAVVFGNAGSALGTQKRQQKMFAETLTKSSSDCGEPNKEEALMESISTALRGKFEVVRNVISTVLSALNEIVPNTDPSVQRIERFLQDVRSSKFEHFFKLNNACYPPLWCSERWLSKLKSIKGIIKQKPFFVKLVQHYPELALNEDDWQFLMEYREAFDPLHKLLKDIRTNQEHVAFSSFYVRCLAVIKDVRGTANRFSVPISRLLGRRLMELREQNAFQAALLLDPRFHFLQSVLLTPVQKSHAQNYILNIWNRINALKPNSQTAQFEADKLKQEDKKDDDMDDFLSEMFGGPSEGTSKAVVPLSSTVTPVLQQLKSLEIEPRQPHDYDVWNHWLQRSVSHAELFSVAMVVMSLPSNNVCLERTYSALILADRNDGLTEQTLDELLLVKLNSSLFEKAVVTMYDWKNITRPQETE